jgi:hypothetical protein
MIEQNINAIQIREIYTLNMLKCLEIDLLLNSGACSRIQYPYQNISSFSSKVNQLIGKNSSIYSVDTALMRLQLDHLLPLSVLSALAGSASMNLSLSDYITRQRGATQASNPPNLMIPLWSKDNGTICRSLFVIADSFRDLDEILSLDPLTVDIDDLIIRGELEEVLSHLKQLNKYKIGMYINLGAYDIASIGVIIKALSIVTIIDTYDPNLSEQKVLLHHRYAPQIRIINDIQDDEHYSTDIYMQDKDILTLSYIMDSVAHLTQKSKSCILIHRTLKGVLASTLVDISCALGITSIYISNPRSEEASQIYNQLIRMG